MICSNSPSTVRSAVGRCMLCGCRGQGAHVCAGTQNKFGIFFSCFFGQLKVLLSSIYYCCTVAPDTSAAMHADARGKTTLTHFVVGVLFAQAFLCAQNNSTVAAKPAGWLVYTQKTEAQSGMMSEKHFKMAITSKTWYRVCRLDYTFRYASYCS